MNIDPSIDMPARAGMFTGEKLHAAYCETVQTRKDEHTAKHETTDLDTHRAELAWGQLSPQGRSLYNEMADVLNVTVAIPTLASLHAQINEMAETLRLTEQERDAWQQLASAHGVQQPAPTAQVLLEQERAAFHARMREMGIPFQEGDHA